MERLPFNMKNADEKSPFLIGRLRTFYCKIMDPQQEHMKGSPFLIGRLRT